MLDLDTTRAPLPARDAATLLVVRDRGEAIEIFCVERHAKSGFLGGAVVFPGGKVDDTDRDASWGKLTSAAPSFGPGDDGDVRAIAIAACREALEEAALLLVRGPAPSHGEVVALRAALGRDRTTFREALATRGMLLDLEALHPFARWITPAAESRRFDTRFFLAVAPEHQDGAHDDHETTASFWASPGEVLRRFDARELQLAPPTHRSLALLATLRSTRDAVELARHACKDPICPRVVAVHEADADTIALVLPGDPEHDVTAPRVPGPGRFVLRDGRWLPEPSPAARAI